MKVFLSLLLSLLIVIGIGFALVSFEFSKSRAYQSDSLIIEKGMTGRAIAKAVANEAGIPSLVSMVAKRLTVHNPVHAGEYDLSDKPSLRTLFNRLDTQEIIARAITIREGLTVYQVINLIKAEPLITDDCPHYKDVQEGSLLPETYAFLRGESCTSLLARMDMAMDTALENAWQNRVADLPYKNKQEALIMASIIEKETGVDYERTKVAGVFVNRLRIGMPMQSDPTTIYALTDGTGELDRPLWRSDWALEHPMNTYHIRALPPKPIANAGLASIKAALNPDEHNYLYFVATGVGGHNFAKTLDQHNRNIVTMKNARRAQ